MELPLGLHTTRNNQVCKLHKSLHGFKQASHQWYDKLSTFLLLHGYKQTNINHSLFDKIPNSKIIILIVYVDDVILAGDDLHEINHT